MTDHDVRQPSVFRPTLTGRLVPGVLLVVMYVLVVLRFLFWDVGDLAFDGFYRFVAPVFVPVGAAIGISYALLNQLPITITHDAIRVPNSWRGLRDDVPWSSVASVDVDDKRGVVRLRGPRRRAIGIPLRRYERSEELLKEITSRALAGDG